MCFGSRFYWSQTWPIHNQPLHSSAQEVVDKSQHSLRPRQNGHHFADDVFKCIFLNENVWILLKISLKFVPKGPINNIPSLVQVMAWRRPGDKPLSEPMMVSLLTHICVARPQLVNNQPQSTTFMIWGGLERIWPSGIVWYQQVGIDNGLDVISIDVVPIGPRPQRKQKLQILIVYVMRIYTTGTKMEYLESTMKPLVFDISICWKWLGTNHKQIIWL